MTNPAVIKAIVEKLHAYQHDPLGFVLWAFPWGMEGTSLADEDGPDQWQLEQLTRLGDSLQSDPYRIIQEATASGHGIGKSTEVAWLILWALMTFPDCRGVVTANTDTQLRTKTWPEVAKWFSLIRSPDLKAMFDLQATSLAARGREKNWRCDAIPWSERNTEGFAGLHNAGRRVFVIMDEGSAIIDRIWEVAEGALTDDETELLWLVFGNPTRNSGRFRECFGRYRHLWHTSQIDSRSVKRTNKKRLDELVETYGVDSDMVKVRVRGMFPAASSMQFISGDVVAAARTRPVPPGLVSDPIIFGVDCARFGDDHSTLAIRQGRDARSRPWKRWHGVDAMTLAADIALEAQRWKPDAIFVDAGSIGAAVCDRLRQIFAGPGGAVSTILIIEVWFGGAGRNVDIATGVPVRTANKRAEIWCGMKAWLEHGALPDEQAIEDDLVGPEYGFNADQAIQLEKKEHMKARGLSSPDDADALACTFAEPVMPRVPAFRDPTRLIAGMPTSHDRFAELRD